MGAGGRKLVAPINSQRSLINITMGGSGEKKESRSVERVPHTKPPFTLGQLKQAIPSHCFKRSLLRSLSYVVFDLSLSFIFYSIATTYFHLLPSPMTYIAWPVYWVFQGVTLLRLWVMGHECGHHAISEYNWVDDIIGLILHSSLLVPYFSFKISHRRHHSNISSLERDEVFVPRLKSAIPWYSKYFNHPPGRLFTIVVALLIGWPLYLAINVSGRPYDRFASHFYPYSPIYSDRERLLIYISDAMIFITAYGLYKIAIAKGLVWLVCIYGVPLLIANALVVTITSLQHTHVALPHYKSTEWDWLRGGLSTVDRDFGVFNMLFHHATDTHVMHHLFSSLPHYHAVEATKAIKPILGDYYLFDDTPILVALWREAKECLFVEPDEGDNNNGVFWYTNKF